jgi:MFS family permease
MVVRAWLSSPRTAVLAAALATLTVNVDWFALNLALPEMAEAFGVQAVDLQWVISGYALSMGSLMVVAGRLGDIFGHRRMLLVGLGIFGTLSLAAGLAQDVEWLVTARVLQGFGAAFITPMAVAVVSNEVSATMRARAVATVFAVGAVGTAIGPLLGGALTQAFGWRAVLLVNVPLCLVLAALVARFVGESRDPAASRHIDVIGVVMVATGLVAVSLGFDRSEAWGWTSPLLIATVVGGVLVLALFVRVEGRMHGGGGRRRRGRGDGRPRRADHRPHDERGVRRRGARRLPRPGRGGAPGRLGAHVHGPSPPEGHPHLRERLGSDTEHVGLAGGLSGGGEVAVRVLTVNVEEGRVVRRPA